MRAVHFPDVRVKRVCNFFEHRFAAGQADETGAAAMAFREDCDLELCFIGPVCGSHGRPWTTQVAFVDGHVGNARKVWHRFPTGGLWIVGNCVVVTCGAIPTRQRRTGA